MVKFNINALYFSNSNLEHSLMLENVCRKLDINIMKCDNVTNLIMRCVQLKPDIVFFDMTTGDLDPVFVQTFCQKGFYYIPSVIMLKNKAQSPIYLSFDNFYKTISVETLEQDLFDIAYQLKMNSTKFRIEKMSSREFENSLYNIFHNFAFNRKHKGYKYLKDAVYLTCCNNGNIQSLTNYLYPTVAAMNSIKPSCVERNIRSAIDYSWEFTRPEALEKFLICGKYSANKKPTNLQVISTLTEYVLREFAEENHNWKK